MKTIYVVSGTVRSGTSMMMKMLKEGGLDLLYTTPEQGNEFNLDGFFETSYLKKIDIYHGWIDRAYDKGMKVFANQLESLPDKYYGDINYKIIFMERDPISSAQSYARMQGRELSQSTNDITERYSKIKDDTNSLIDRQDNMDILYVKYDDVLEDPEGESLKIKNFLGLDLDTTKMATVPNPERRHF